jgi:hypothetical protein
MGERTSTSYALPVIRRRRKKREISPVPTKTEVIGSGTAARWMVMPIEVIPRFVPSLFRSELYTAFTSDAAVKASVPGIVTTN